jgi:hypothetical protein
VVNWSGTGLPEEFGDVPPVAFNAGLREIITAEYLQALTSDAVDQVFDMLEGNTARFVLTFDLVPIKAALSGAGASDFATAYVEALPVCRANQSALSPGSRLPVCRESDAIRSELVAQVEEALPGLAESLPNELGLAREVIPPDIAGVPWSLANIGQITTVSVVILGIVALIFWLIDGFILGTETRERLLWLGFMLLIPAGLVLLTGIGMSMPSIETVIRDSILRGEGVGNVQLATSVATAAVSATEQVRTGFLIAGGIPTLIAVVLLIIGLATRPSDKPKNDGRYVQIPSQY